MRPENLVIRAVEATDAEGLTRLQNNAGISVRHFTHAVPTP
jgi:hypothetical protein